VGGPSFRFRADGPTVSTKVAFSNTKDRGRRDTHPLGDRSYATSAKECTNDNRHFATLLIATESWVGQLLWALLQQRKNRDGRAGIIEIGNLEAYRVGF
jgi:hypothetical protein